MWRIIIILWGDSCRVCILFIKWKSRAWPTAAAAAAAIAITTGEKSRSRPICVMDIFEFLFYFFFQQCIPLRWFYFSFYYWNDKSSSLRHETTNNIFSNCDMHRNGRNNSIAPSTLHTLYFLFFKLNWKSHSKLFDSSLSCHISLAFEPKVQEYVCPFKAVVMYQNRNLWRIEFYLILRVTRPVAFHVSKCQQPWMFDSVL